MKNYSLDSEEAKTFVLNYTVENNQITINFASGENYVISYSKEAEAKILQKMKTQVLQASKFMREQKKLFTQFWNGVKWNAFMIVLNVIALVSDMSLAPILTDVCVCFFGVCTIYYLYNLIDTKRNIQDVEKNEMLLNNEKRINDRVKDNSNILESTNEKTKKMVSSILGNQPIFTLNTIDKIPLEELQKILENIDREDDLSLSKKLKKKKIK